MSDIMTKSVIHSVSRNASVRKAAERMKEVHSGCLVVMSRSRLAGIITERDLVQRVIAEGRPVSRTLVWQIMSKPVVTTSPDASLSEAAKLMIKRGIRRLAVTNDNSVTGMLTVTDFARYLSSERAINKEEKGQLLAASARSEYQTIFE